MSQSGYTDDNYSATDGTVDEPVDDQTNDQDQLDNKIIDNNDETVNKDQVLDKTKIPEPEPEPEPDPLEGLTYEDDPSIQLPPYGDSSYWEQRYTEDSEPFEWYQEPKSLLKTFKELLEPEGKVLVVGTGTSELAPFLIKNGYENVTAIDYVKQPILKMKKRNRELENLIWKVMDVKKMSFMNSEFNSIIDKGTLDCVYHLGDNEVFEMMSEISRVLKKRGVFICISCAPPEVRKKFFDRPADLLLELEKIIEIPKPIQSNEPHYIYVIRKIGKLLT